MYTCMFVGVGVYLCVIGIYSLDRIERRVTSYNYDVNLSRVLSVSLSFVSFSLSTFTQPKVSPESSATELRNHLVNLLLGRAPETLGGDKKVDSHQV